MEVLTDVACSQCKNKFEFLQKPIYRCEEIFFKLKCLNTLCNLCITNTTCTSCLNPNVPVLYPDGYYFYFLLKKELENIVLKFVPRPLAEPMNSVRQIYQKIKSKENLRTFHRMKDSDEVKFGKISIWANTLYFHSLDLTDPQDCTEFIKFRDLEKIFPLDMNLKKDFRLFLKICSSKNIDYIINIRIKKSKRTPHFVSHFTGECGSSYKGSVSKSGSFAIQSRIKCLENPSDTIGHYFNLSDDVEAPRTENSFFVVIGNNYDIYFPKDKSHQNKSVGIAEMSSDLRRVIEHEEGKVVDCGFSLTIF